jgi:hypothetical protein
MPSRDLWTQGRQAEIQGLLRSLLSALALLPADSEPLYISSPWVTDFPLFANRQGEYSALLPEFEEGEILFSTYLAQLSRRRPVRIVTVDNPASRCFVEGLAIRTSEGIEVRFAGASHHEKGMLGPYFYIEGSMNITFHGVYLRSEKITCHSHDSADGRAKIAQAYLEFNRLWNNLKT